MDTLMTAHPHSPPSDELELVRMAVNDAEAFAELYRRYLQPVYRYHMAHTGDRREAEDLTSQTFMAALEGIGSFRAEGSFAAWLMGIASRKKALFFRGRKPQIPLEEASGLSGPELPTDQAAALRLQIRSVAQALKQISRERAQAIMLCAFAGFSLREAAGIMRKSEAAVKMLLARGLQDLRTRTSLAMEVE